MLPRIDGRAGNRQRRRLDDDRRAGAAACERFDPLALEREAQRVANSGADICDAFAGRRRPQHDRVVGSRRDDEPRAGEERDAQH